VLGQILPSWDETSQGQPFHGQLPAIQQNVRVSGGISWHFGYWVASLLLSETNE
jgi:hypothetical protein